MSLWRKQTRGADHFPPLPEITEYDEMTLQFWSNVTILGGKGSHLSLDVSCPIMYYLHSPGGVLP